MGKNDFIWDEGSDRKWWQDLLILGAGVLGTALIEEMTSKNKETTTPKKSTFSEKLEELERLKREGKISEEEYRLARQSLFKVYGELE